MAILGGTGAEGFGLALRWAQCGVRVIIGSREAGKARDAAERLRRAVPQADVEGLVNSEAAAQAKVVVLTVPLAAQIATIKAVRDRLRPDTIFVDATVPLGVALGDRVSHLIGLWAGSAAEQAAAYLPPHVRTVSAFHWLSAHALTDLEHPVDCDVLVCGDNADARAAVGKLVEKIAGARPVEGGPLCNSRFAESAAAMLIALNIRHKVKQSGLRITGISLPRAADPAAAAGGEKAKQPDG